MKLSMKTYQVSAHYPAAAVDRVPNDTLAVPNYRRIAASTATRAIAKFQNDTVHYWNEALKDQSRRGDFVARIPDDGRTEEKFYPKDFPIVEVKVVA